MNTSQVDLEANLAARIREACRSSGLSQRELATLIGVSPHTVWA